MACHNNKSQIEGIRKSVRMKCQMCEAEKEKSLRENGSMVLHAEMQVS